MIKINRLVGYLEMKRIMFSWLQANAGSEILGEKASIFAMYTKPILCSNSCNLYSPGARNFNVSHIFSNTRVGMHPQVVVLHCKLQCDTERSGP